MSVPLPQFITLPSSLFWKGLSHSASLVEGGSHCGRYSQPLASRDGAGCQAPYPRLAMCKRDCCDTQGTHQL